MKKIFSRQSILPDYTNHYDEKGHKINCHMGFSGGSATTVRDVSNAYQQFPLAWITHVADEAATYLLDR